MKKSTLLLSLHPVREGARKKQKERTLKQRRKTKFAPRFERDCSTAHAKEKSRACSRVCSHLLPRPECARRVASGRGLGEFVVLRPVLCPRYARVASVPVRACLVLRTRGHLFSRSPFCSDARTPLRTSNTRGLGSGKKLRGKNRGNFPGARKVGTDAKLRLRQFRIECRIKPMCHFRA